MADSWASATNSFIVKAHFVATVPRRMVSFLTLVHDLACTFSQTFSREKVSTLQKSQNFSLRFALKQMFMVLSPLLSPDRKWKKVQNFKQVSSTKLRGVDSLHFCSKTNFMTISLVLSPGESRESEESQFRVFGGKLGGVVSLHFSSKVNISGS